MPGCDCPFFSRSLNILSRDAINQCSTTNSSSPKSSDTNSWDQLFNRSVTTVASVRDLLLRSNCADQCRRRPGDTPFRDPFLLLADPPTRRFADPFPPPDLLAVHYFQSRFSCCRMTRRRSGTNWSRLRSLIESSLRHWLAESQTENRPGGHGPEHYAVLLGSILRRALALEANRVPRISQ